MGSLFVVILIGYIFYSFAQPRSESTGGIRQSAAPPSEASEPPKTPTWHRSEFTDDMTGAVTKVAILRSLNTTEFGFPYNKQGGSALNLVVRKTGAKHDAYFKIDKGQMLCSASRCNMRIKIGDQPPEIWKGSTSKTYDSDVIFILHDYTLREALSAGKPLKVGIDFYQAGERVFNFDTSGYQPL